MNQTGRRAGAQGARLITCVSGKRDATSRSRSQDACFRSPTVSGQMGAVGALTGASRGEWTRLWGKGQQEATWHVVPNCSA